MRCSLLAAAAAVVLAFATPLAEASICSKYADALGVGQKALMDTLITRVVTGVSDASQTLGNTGTFVGLRKTTNPPLDVLDVVSTANFGAISNTITLVGSTGDQIVGVARRPNNGLFYFIDQAAQMYTGDIDGAIRNFNSTVNLTPLGTPVTARTTGSVSKGIGFAFNPVGDAIRITNGNTNFRVNPNTGAAAAPDGASADGTDAGGSFTYQDPIEGSSPSVVATAYTNQIGTSPRDPATTFGTTQYGIDQANNLFVRFNNSNAGLIGANFPIALESGATADFTVNTGLTVVSQPNGAGNVIVASIVRTINGAKSSGLYTINPNTGAATPLAGALNTNTYRAIAFTDATGNNGVIVPKNPVTGIFNTANIVGYFNRGILFEDPATQPDYTTSTADLIDLRDKLVSFFGGPLGCDSTQVPPAANAPSQYVVHRNMNITKPEFDAFNLQVSTAATSFGVSVAEVSEIEGVLQLFNRQPFGDNSRAICTQPGCDCAPGYDPANNCQTILSTSSSSSGSGSGSTGTSTAPDNNNTGAAAGLSAPFALVAALAVAVAALRA